MQKRGDGAVGGRAAEIGEKERKTPVFLRRSIEVPSKFLRNITLTSPLLHLSCTLAAGWALAERAGTGRWGLGEMGEMRRLPKQAGVERLLSEQGVTGLRAPKALPPDAAEPTLPA